MKDGIIVINKPEGMTSNDVIYRMKRILGIKKIGHSGTLDPMARGVLPVLINKGTRVAEYMDVDDKEYICEMKLGMETTTLDITGEVLLDAYKGEDLNTEEALMAKHLTEITESDVMGAFRHFCGLIEQLPPMTSAVRIEGKRLYEYTHKGDIKGLEEIKSKIKKRQVFIKNLQVTDINLPYVKYKITCSKGTYIRSICRDVGEILGTKATMTELIRSRSGNFTIEKSKNLNELLEEAVSLGILDENFYSVEKNYNEDIPEVWLKYVLPLDFDIGFFGAALVDKEMGNKFIDGWHLSYNDIEIIEKPTYEPPVSLEEIKAANPNSEGYNEGSYAGIKVKPEYEKAYRIYFRDEREPKKIKSENFLGVAFHSDKYKKLVADKIFARGKI